MYGLPSDFRKRKVYQEIQWLTAENINQMLPWVLQNFPDPDPRISRIACAEWEINRIKHKTRERDGLPFVEGNPSLETLLIANAKDTWSVLFIEYPQHVTDGFGRLLFRCSHGYHFYHPCRSPIRHDDPYTDLLAEYDFVELPKAPPSLRVVGSEENRFQLPAWSPAPTPETSQPEIEREVAITA